ncbi:MAG TPA: restriction endonuclease [Gammaproteobacteria bacterium]|nr:restriction endonuclease [Gammaproteobacteria bacterium]
MAIPDYQTFMLPALSALADADTRSRNDVATRAADALGVSAEERELVLPSGKTNVFRSRAGWALTYMKHAGLVATTRRGIYQITDRGRSVLARRLPRIDNEVLREFPEFLDFLNRSHAEKASAPAAPDALPGPVATASPEEALEAAYDTLRETLVSQVIDALKSVSPSHFERIVIDVLQAMGYGGGRAGAARAIGRSGDGGIDGVIEEDRLGLDTVYVQAKRWEGTVGRPTVQAFAGALQGQRAHKGVMITTSDFSADAKRYIENLTMRIVLIDGQRLAEMMIDHDVGVTAESTYTIKRLDSDYFEE